MRKTISAVASVLLVAAVVSGQTRPAGPVKPVKPSPELLAMWAELEPKREAAAALARTVTDDTMAQAKKNQTELMALTEKFNAMLAPVATSSPIRPTSLQPRKGIEKAIWLYKISRQIELYNSSKRDEMTEQEYRSIELLNEYRECLGIVPYEYDSRLRDAARGHAEWMTEHAACEHVEKDRPAYLTDELRMIKAGYRGRPNGENIAKGQPTPEWVFKDWFESHEHHHNLVADYTHVGIGVVGDAWVQDFSSGMPAKAPAYKPKPATRPAGAGATSRP